VLEKYKVMNDEKKRQENEQEKLEQQNEAFEIFNEIDTNKNNKYNFIFKFILFSKKVIVNYIFRIEEEEVDAYNTFDQNKDGIVSQDEKDVIIIKYYSNLLKNCNYK